MDVRKMTYYFETEMDCGFDEAITRVRSALNVEGFGVLTDIDVKATFKKKLDRDMRPYRILGACNPPSAFKAIEGEPNIGLMLPCNVVVQEVDGIVKVSAVDPMASMMAVDNPALGEVAREVREKLKKVISSL